MGGGGGQPGSQQVAIEEGVALGIYPVTQAQWRALMGNNPSYFSRTGAGKDKVKSIPDADLWQFPVEQVSWDDCEQFLVKLNERQHGSGWLYRLPTEAEWEYLCREGATSKEECSFHFYLDKPSNALSSKLANFDGNRPEGGAAKGVFLERTTKVGSYPANRLGLYDLHGNVWEWCSDWYEPSYQQVSSRVVRGGSWSSRGCGCQAASRSRDVPSDRSFYLGFRVARVPSGG
jgi:formylglycine-generating enzyme required for sulfatase activity